MKTFIEEILSGRKVKTRDGRKVKILTTKMKNELYPIVAIIMNENGEENVETYTQEGECVCGTEQDSDLVLIPLKVTKYYNVYNTSLGHVSGNVLFDSFKEAKAIVNEFESPGYLYTKSVEIEL